MMAADSYSTVGIITSLHYITLFSHCCYTMIRATIFLALVVVSIQGFACQAPTSASRTNSNTQLQASVSRSQFLSTAAAALTATALFPLSPANAKDKVDPLLKGTKGDPAYQTCISTCLYECTKPKGEETKLRQECIPECKVKCATTKQQLMVGTPLAK
jgi:hypothetical protein